MTTGLHSYRRGIQRQYVAEVSGATFHILVTSLEPFGCRSPEYCQSSDRSHCQPNKHPSCRLVSTYSSTRTAVTHLERDGIRSCLFRLAISVTGSARMSWPLHGIPLPDELSCSPFTITIPALQNRHLFSIRRLQPSLYPFFTRGGNSLVNLTTVFRVPFLGQIIQVLLEICITGSLDFCFPDLWGRGSGHGHL